MFFSASEFDLSYNCIDYKGNSSKYVKDPVTIDFSAYKKKLKFTGSAVDLLEVDVASPIFASSLT